MDHLPSRKRLHRLLYSSQFSQSFPTLFADQEDEIGKIIRASIRNNRDAAITGLLLIHRCWFLQVLEGPPAAVEDTYRRITTDGRHTNMHVLSNRTAERREFPNWNMCARRVSRADDAILDGLGELYPEGWTADGALGLLLKVRGVQADTMSALT
jgi:hypothetical protein